MRQLSFSAPVDAFARTPVNPESEPTAGPSTEKTLGFDRVTLKAKGLEYLLSTHYARMPGVDRLVAVARRFQRSELVVELALLDAQAGSNQALNLFEGLCDAVQRRHAQQAITPAMLSFWSDDVLAGIAHQMRPAFVSERHRPFRAMPAETQDGRAGCWSPTSPPTLAALSSEEQALALLDGAIGDAVDCDPSLGDFDRALVAIDNLVRARHEEAVARLLGHRRALRTVVSRGLANVDKRPAASGDEAQFDDVIVAMQRARPKAGSGIAMAPGWSPSPSGSLAAPPIGGAEAGLRKAWESSSSMDARAYRLHSDKSRSYLRSREKSLARTASKHPRQARSNARVQHGDTRSESPAGADRTLRDARGASPANAEPGRKQVDRSRSWGSAVSHFFAKMGASLLKAFSVFDLVRY